MGRRWLPWKLELRKPHESLDLDSDDVENVGCLWFLDDIFVVVGIVIAILLFALFVVPLFIALVEVVVLALLVVAGVLVRVAFRRPWIVDAVRIGGHGRYSWKVVGWRRSGELVDSVAMELALGRVPPVDV